MPSILSYTQSALSRHVRLLETELGKTLLVRTGRGVKPTAAGKVLLEQGRGVMHQIDRFHDELARENAGLVGKVALGLPTCYTVSHCPSAVNASAAQSDCIT